MEAELDLRDIHWPAPVGWWPPAPGWWLLLLGSLALLVLAVWAWRFLRRQTARKLALAELERIASSAAGNLVKVQQLAILLRRTSMSVYPREFVASLVGESWLVFLDRHMPNKDFSVGAGRLLVEAPYRRESQIDLQALMAVCRDWIVRLPNKRQVGLVLPEVQTAEDRVEPPAAASNVEPIAPAGGVANSRFARPSTVEHHD